MGINYNFKGGRRLSVAEGRGDLPELSQLLFQHGIQDQVQLYSEKCTDDISK